MGSRQFPIGIPLRGIARIARNDCFCLRHFIAGNRAITTNNEAIKYSRNCAELRGIVGNGIAFNLKINIFELRLTNLRSRYKNGNI